MIRRHNHAALDRLSWPPGHTIRVWKHNVGNNGLRQQIGSRQDNLDLGFQRARPADAGHGYGLPCAQPFSVAWVDEKLRVKLARIGNYIQRRRPCDVARRRIAFHDHSADGRGDTVGLQAFAGCDGRECLPLLDTIPDRACHGNDATRIPGADLCPSFWLQLHAAREGDDLVDGSGTRWLNLHAGGVGLPPGNGRAAFEGIVGPFGRLAGPRGRDFHLEGVRLGDDAVAEEVVFPRRECERVYLVAQPQEFNGELDFVRRQRLVILICVDVELGINAVLENGHLDCERAIAKHTPAVRPALILARRGSSLRPALGARRFLSATSRHEGGSRSSDKHRDPEGCHDRPH